VGTGVTTRPFPLEKDLENKEEARDDDGHRAPEHQAGACIILVLNLCNKSDAHSQEDVIPM